MCQFQCSLVFFIEEGHETICTAVSQRFALTTTKKGQSLKVCLSPLLPFVVLQSYQWVTVWAIVYKYHSAVFFWITFWYFVEQSQTAECWFYLSCGWKYGQLYFKSTVLQIAVELLPRYEHEQVAASLGCCQQDRPWRWWRAGRWCVLRSSAWTPTAAEEWHKQASGKAAGQDKSLQR